MRQAVSIIPAVLPMRTRVSARKSDSAACRGTRWNGASWPPRRRARYLPRALYSQATDRPSKLATNRGGPTVGGARGLAQSDPVPSGRVQGRDRNAGPFRTLAGRVAPADSGRRSRTGALREAGGAFWPRGASIPSDRPGPCKPFPRPGRCPATAARSSFPRGQAPRPWPTPLALQGGATDAKGISVCQSTRCSRKRNWPTRRRAMG